MRKKNGKRISHSPGMDVWRRMRKNPLGMAGIYTVGLAVLLALFAYLIMPDSTPMANEMSLPLSVKKPGFSIKMLWVRKNKQITETTFLSKLFSGEESEYEKIPLQSYSFQGAD